MIQIKKPAIHSKSHASVKTFLKLSEVVAVSVLLTNKI